MWRRLMDLRGDYSFCSVSRGHLPPWTPPSSILFDARPYCTTRSYAVLCTYILIGLYSCSTVSVYRKWSVTVPQLNALLSLAGFRFCSSSFAKHFFFFSVFSHLFLIKLTVFSHSVSLISLVCQYSCQHHHVVIHLEQPCCFFSSVRSS